jgi:rhamnulokinase
MPPNYLGSVNDRMKKTQSCIAVDLGAESGRIAVGQFDETQLQVSIKHRFLNRPVQILDGLHWNVQNIWQEVMDGMALCAQDATDICGLGIDSWAQDFGLFGSDDTLLGMPYCYRDSRTHGIIDEITRHVSNEKIFRTTGIPCSQITTLSQLYTMVLTESPMLKAARFLLTIPDIFHFWLTGQVAMEFTHANISQCYSQTQKAWANELFGELGIPSQIFPKVMGSGAILGRILPSIEEKTNLTGANVILPACHDTASAVVAVPAYENDYLYVSCGTWSAIGAVIDTPNFMPEGVLEDLHFEGWVENKTRITLYSLGLWLVQECRRTWGLNGERHDYTELTQMASRGKSLKSIINPDDQRFIAPGDILSSVRSFCKETNQPFPDNKGDILRCILESLALNYRYGKEIIESLMGRRVKAIHMVGGGIQNRLLCQFFADATQMEVIAGPIEASAVGNCIMQGIGLGWFSTVNEGRKMINKPTLIDIYEPDTSDQSQWEDAYHRFLSYRV